MLWKPAPREAQTTIGCGQCDKPLLARRTCHHAYLYCEHCRKEFLLQEYIPRMDEALETFLEAIDCDRV